MKWRRAIRHPNGPKSPTVRHVLLTIATWGDKDGGSMFPAVETLAVATRRARTTVDRAIKTAMQTGWILRGDRRRGPFGKPRYCYEASVPAGWSFDNDVDHPWEVDPQWVSERYNRNKARRVYVPSQLGDTDTPASADSSDTKPACPLTGDIVSPHSARDVPSLTTPCPLTTMHDLLMTSSKTSSGEGPLTRTALVEKGLQEKKPGTQPDRPAARPNGSGKPNRRLERVLQEEAKRPEKPDLTASIRQLLEAGHGHEDVVHILAGRGCTLLDVYRVHKAATDAA
jgi:hypothetical protein